MMQCRVGRAAKLLGKDGMHTGTAALGDGMMYRGELHGRPQGARAHLAGCACSAAREVRRGAHLVNIVLVALQLHLISVHPAGKRKQ